MLERAKLFIDCQQIQQTLRWMLTTSIAAIDDTAMDRRTLNQLLIVVLVAMTDNGNIYANR